MSELDPVLFIDEAGVVHVLATDAVDLRALGRVRGRRVSHIEWVDDAQRWRCILASGEWLGDFGTRGAAVAAEVAELNARIERVLVKGDSRRGLLLLPCSIARAVRP